MTMQELALIYFVKTQRCHVGKVYAAQLYPYIVMDLAREEAEKVIFRKAVSVSIDLDKRRKLWRDTNNGLWKWFKTIFGSETYDEVLGYMDECQEFCSEEIKSVRKRIRTILKDMDPLQRDVIAASQICLLMCQEAQDLFGMFYRDKKGRVEVEKNIKRFEEHADLFSKGYYKENHGKIGVSLRKDAKLTAAIATLETRLVDWSRIKDNIQA